jgi:uncharacterized protein (DUF488 family)
MAYPFFTIGHSTRTLSQFVDLLRASQIELVVDVRRFPRSRANPQFNRETFPDPLATVQIGYVYISALGGLRRSSRTDISLNLFWENLSFRNYADYAMTQEFHEGLTELRDLVTSTARRSCVRKRFGGGVIAGSLRILLFALGKA